MSTTEKVLRVGFIGNPNCGKTTLFNAFTGANLKVANWPGVTVEKVEGVMRYHDQKIQLVDLPGTYSLTSYTMEEKISREYILSDEVDVIIDVVDASSLERNLYLTLQLLELGKPVVMALNMMDIVEKRGMQIDLHRLPEMLGIPVIPVSGRKRQGLEILIHAALHHQSNAKPDRLIHNHSDASRHQHSHHDDYAMVYHDDIEDKIDLIIEQLRQQNVNPKHERWIAIKLLEQDRQITEQYPLDLSNIMSRSYESDIINQKYDFIEEIVEEVLVHKQKRAALTDKIDQLLTNKWLGLPLFLAIMALVFFLTFTIGDALKAVLEGYLDSFSVLLGGMLDSLHIQGTVQSLMLDGIYAGVAGILTFLPNIIILFLALAFLEDSGYMSRVAYVMDDIMAHLGLSGRAFIPMILGFGCTVPAIMASRALENKKDRLKTMLITPFMSCSARLPIYILFSEVFFAENALPAAYSMYLLGIFVAITVAYVLHKFEKTENQSPLLIELPEYKIPSGRTVMIYVWEKVKDFLTKAGTTIFLASIVMWFILNFGPSGYTTEMNESFASIIGQWVVPVFVPIGLGYWQIVVALIAGISAKEVVVSSCAVLFGISSLSTVQGSSEFLMQLNAMGFTALNAYCMMVFCLLYVPCIGTIITIKKESGSWKTTAQMVLFQLAVAWVVTFVIYQVGSMIL